MALDARWLEEILASLLPREGEHGRLAVTPWNGRGGYPAQCAGVSPLGVWACLELTPRTGRGVTKNICVLIPSKHSDQPVPRARAYVEGWLGAVDHFLSHAAPLVIENAIPQNLVYPKVLDLARTQTSDAFRKAILAPSRLGKLVGDVATAMRSIDTKRA